MFRWFRKRVSPQKARAFCNHDDKHEFACRERKEWGELSSAMPLESIAVKFERHEISLKSGTLRFFGEWFGRPMDNFHQIVKFQFDQATNILEIGFDEGEKLIVWNPADYHIGEKEFMINVASKVRWEWYHYGNAKNSDNLYCMEYLKQESYIEVVSGKIGSDDKTGKQLRCSREPAVEIC